MYLLEVHISNLRAIHDLTLDFRDKGPTATPNNARRWTVLLGENGCGKSTILKAIGLLLAGSEALADLIDEPARWVRNGAKQATISAKICTAEGAERNLSLTIDRQDRRDAVIKRNSTSLRELDAALEHTDRNYFIAGYGAFRRPPDPQQKTRSHFRSTGRTANLHTMFSSSPDLVSLEQWALQLDYVEGKKGRTIVADALEQLLPGMSFKSIDKRSGEVVMQTVDGEVPLRQLSEGYQAMAAWTGDLLFRMSETFQDRTNPLHARGVLLIDEMDLHLHPVWKRRLVEFINLAFPNLQVISTTHSPLSVQQCNEGELYVVRREKGGPTLVPFIGDPSIMRLSELFLSPLVGLESLDSPKVTVLRAEAEKIELKSGARTSADTQKLRDINEQLKGTTPLAPAEAPALVDMLDSGGQTRPPVEERIRVAKELYSHIQNVAPTRRPSTRKKAAASTGAALRAKASSAKKATRRRTSFKRKSASRPRPR